MDLIQPYETYNGGKSGAGVYQHIINQVPKCSVFVEAMAGNGGVISHLSRPQLSIINDIDTEVYTAWNIANEGRKFSPRVCFSNQHYAQLIREYENTPGVVFYFDPPYLFETRKGGDTPIYRHEWKTNDHLLFLQQVTALRANCIISHYPCGLYDNILKNWRTFDFMANTRAGLATERLYMNFKEPAELQDYRYLGTDYIDRQRIKRKTDRFINKLKRMPDKERRAIVEQVFKNFPESAGKQ